MTNFKLTLNTLNTLNTLALLFIFVFSANVIVAQHVQETPNGISIKSDPILDADGNLVHNAISEIDFRNSNNGPVFNLKAFPASLDVTSTRVDQSSMNFYNSNNEYLGAFHFRKFNGQQAWGGLTDGNGKFCFLHRTGLSTDFSINEDIKMQIWNDGKVIIGSYLLGFQGGDKTKPQISSNEFKLFVDKGILTEKVKVAGLSTDDWADYVFEEDYEMLPLGELESYVKENKHLPNVPSAQEVADNGLDLAKTDATLLEKIEESYLYIIELNKKFEALAAENNNLKSDMKALQTSQN